MTALASGRSPWAVDGHDIIALSTASPPYRNLRSGMTGEDVDTLQRELTRLGYPTRIDGVFGDETLNAWNELRESLGAPTSTAFRLADTIWLPRSRVPLRSCAVRLGNIVLAGEPIAQTTPRVTSIRLTGALTDLVQGVRRLTVGGTTVTLDEPGAVTDRASIRRIMRTEAVRLAVQTTGPNGTEDLSGQLALRRPLMAASVPISAVFGTQERLCVRSSTGASVPVRVLASSLGRSVISTRHRAWPTSISVSPGSSARCE
ncbi:peptidoglycan-binding domain-containing protein [Nocardioides sp.]